MSKQDRQGVRTTQGLEQKYSFGKVFTQQERENARQNSEMNQQNLTMKQFIAYANESINKLNTSVESINKSIVALSKKDTELEKKDSSLLSKIEAYWKTVYPVGAIYLSVSNNNPSELFGGTWVRIEDRFLLSAGDTYKAGSTGGEATHKLSVDEMPSHKHKVYQVANATISAGSGSNILFAGENWAQGTIETQATGGGSAHNNMPPYLAVYVWKRTA